MIKSRRMRWVAQMGKKWNACRLLVGKPEGKRLQGSPICRCVDNIKLDLVEIVWVGVDWNGLAQDRHKCRALANAVINLQIL
jgi:hypothetical protein